jgi:predicted  nucleic acid-binding Zn-ribbon protein
VKANTNAVETLLHKVKRWEEQVNQAERMIGQWAELKAHAEKELAAAKEKLEAVNGRAKF